MTTQSPQLSAVLLSELESHLWEAANIAFFPASIARCQASKG